MLVRILHVAQVEIQTVHEGLLIKAPIGCKHIEGIVERERAEIEGRFPGEHCTWAALTLEIGEHKLLGVRRQGRGLLRLTAQADTVERMHRCGHDFLLQEVVYIQAQVGGGVAGHLVGIPPVAFHFRGAELGGGEGGSGKG